VKQQIDEILAPFPNAGCEFNGKFWEVWIGSQGGAREDGVSLARELAEKVRGLPKPAAKEAPVPRPDSAYVAKPEPVEIPAFLKEPAHDPRLDLKDARIAELEAALAAAAAPKPEPMTANPPAEALDVIDWTAPPKERQEALLVKLREVIGLIGLAEDRGGRADPSLYRKRDVIESGIRYNRATLAETI
jgi:hypothetical protein